MSDLPIARRGLAIRLQLARCALLWERVWPACWPALAILCGFLILALSGLLSRLPGLAHGALLLALGAAFLLALAAARRRIERASGLRHRPLAALCDRPGSVLDPPAAGLWQAHLAQMAGAARRLRVGWPSAGLAGRDRRGLRAVLAMALL